MGDRNDGAHVKYFGRGLLKPEDSPGVMIYKVIGAGGGFVKFNEEFGRGRYCELLLRDYVIDEFHAGIDASLGLWTMKIFFCYNAVVRELCLKVQLAFRVRIGDPC